MVSHAVSHLLITTTVNKRLDAQSIFKFRKTFSCFFRDIIVVLVMPHVSLSTCTQCVPVVLLVNHDLLFDRRDRASNTSFACWKSNVRFYQCKIRIYFLQFQKLQYRCVSQEAPFTVSSHLVISKQLRFVGSKESAPSHCSDLLTTNNVFSAKRW